MISEVATLPAHAAEGALLHLLMQLAVVIVTARLLGSAALRIGQPRVVGEIVGGLLLGPSFLGALVPSVFARLFPPGGEAVLSAFSQVGLVFLMLRVGMGFDGSHLRGRADRRAVLAVTAGSIGLPLVCGGVLGARMHPVFAPQIEANAFCGFVAVALSITALPILGRILMDFGLMRTRLGSVTIAAAAVNDIVGWLLLGAVSALAAGRFSAQQIAVNIALLAVFFVALFGVLGPIVRSLLRRALLRENSAASPEPHVAASNLGPEAWIAALALLFGVVTIELGIFAIFGGFLAGVLVSRERAFVERWQRRSSPFIDVFFLPIFFTSTGLRTRVGSLQELDHWIWCVAVIFVAISSKLFGSWLGAVVSGLPAMEARCVAVMMNTRGLMELIVLNVGFDLGILPAPVFTMLVFMAVVSTILTGPWLRRLLAHG